MRPPRGGGVTATASKKGSEFSGKGSGEGFSGGF